jgi:hypothetical protein
MNVDVEGDFDVFAFVQAARDGKKIKRPHSISSSVDDRGLITMCNESGRPCVDATKAIRVLLIGDLRRGHPKLKSGLLGWTMPNTSDFYRYVGVEFDNGVKEVVSVATVQPVQEDCASELAQQLIAQHMDTAFDWNDAVAIDRAREIEKTTYKNHIVVDGAIRNGSGPHEVYAYTFPSLLELAKARNEEHVPMKIGYTAVSSEHTPSLARIGEQLGESAARYEPAVLIGIWQCWNGRELETKVHKRLKTLGRKVQTSIGKEWYRSSPKELDEMVASIGKVERSSLPLCGPLPDGMVARHLPAQSFAERITVCCYRLNADATISVQCINFDDLLEEASPAEIRDARGR